MPSIGRPIAIAVAVPGTDGCQILGFLLPCAAIDVLQKMADVTAHGVATPTDALPSSTWPRAWACRWRIPTKCCASEAARLHRIGDGRLLQQHGKALARFAAPHGDGHRPQRPLT